MIDRKRVLRMEDIVISSYKQQIKESALKAEAVKAGGFDIVIEELEKRGINTVAIKEYFNKIINSHTKDDLYNLTIDELTNITNDINSQVTRALIAKAEISDVLIRRSKLVALAKSPNGKITEDDKYAKVGNNLATEINKYGIAEGLNTCIRNYCTQKIYQADYREKIIEKQKQLGIYDETSKMESKQKLNEKIDYSSYSPSTKQEPKNRILKEIFKTDYIDNTDITFETAKQNYDSSIRERLAHLNDMK